ncbi:MAG TPA: hypothetical protein VI139_01460, partial [Gemmatimonadales bacterium]
MTQATRLALAVISGGFAAAAAAQQAAPNPHGHLTEECAVCHSAAGWTPAHVRADFDHAKHGFVLAGAHGQTGCRSCHTSLQFAGTRTECVACHKDVHHGELGADCARCHTARNFLDRTAMTRAHELTSFPLRGAHAAVDCESCHTPGAAGHLTFVNLPRDCVACHLPQYQGAKNPDHAAGGFSQDCATCHAPTVWSSARFNHDASGFPLTGAHRAAACAQCHGDGVYAGKSTACASCHQADYDATTDPIHSAAGFATTCQTCHTTSGWTGAAFNHTWFPV